MDALLKLPSTSLLTRDDDPEGGLSPEPWPLPQEVYFQACRSPLAREK